MRRKIPKPTRAKVVAKWGMWCVYCGEPADHLDHLVPFHAWKGHHEANLVPACYGCGTAKGSMMPNDPRWISMLLNIRNLARLRRAEGRPVRVVMIRIREATKPT